MPKFRASLTITVEAKADDIHKIRTVVQQEINKLAASLEEKQCELHEVGHHVSQINHR